MPGQIEIGRLLRSSTAGFVVGCRVSQLDVPSFGALVRAPLGDDYQVYGLIHDIQVGDDGLVRQIVTAENVSPEVILDNRERRIVPVEVSVVTLGYERLGSIYHQLPPRPPVSLDLIYLCDDGRREAVHVRRAVRIPATAPAPRGPPIGGVVGGPHSASGGRPKRWGRLEGARCAGDNHAARR